MNHAARSRRFALFVLCLLIVHHSSFIVRGGDTPPPDPLKSDAQLASVYFVDPLQGCAVGDRGVIWHTADGGMSWQLQDSTVECRLSAVQFLDANNGWAVGGSTQPYTHATTGVVLKTADGGQHWTSEPTWTLPILDQMKFVDPRRGWGVGRGSALFPSGLFATERGGRDWVPLVGDGLDAHTWTAAEWFDSRNGVAAARDGSLLLVKGQTLEPVRAPVAGLRAARQIKRLDAKNGWLAGDGGLLLRTGDAGRTWQPPPAPLPTNAEEFDFLALAAHGDKIILAGTPGSRVFTSSDGGRTWIDYPTGQSLPIRALDFVDDDRGWAVGDLGLVMATRDGGRSWKRQQSGGVRTAVLGIFCEPDDVPLELFARISAGEGYLTHVAILTRGDLETPGLASGTLPLRAHEALAALGSSGADTAWQFPIRNRQLALPARQIVAPWSEASADQGSAKLDEYLVRLIRTWRPDVIVTHDASPRGDDPVAYLVNQAVLRAVDKAAAPVDSPENSAGLEPWSARKVFGMLPPGQGGGTNVTATEIAPRSGRSLAELTWQGRSILYDTFTMAPASIGFRALVNRLPQEAGRGDLLVGIPDGRGESRRRPSDSPRDNVDVLRRAAQKRRNLQAMLARSTHDPTPPARWIGSMADLVGDLDETTAGEFTFQLAYKLFQSGHWQLAADTFALLPKRHPKHPLTPAALAWLVQYYSSGEVTARLNAEPTFGVVPVVERQVNPRESAAVVPVTAETPLQTVDATGAHSASNRMAEAARYGAELEKMSPAAFAEPAVKFSLASAARQGSGSDADRSLAALVRGRPRDAWLAAAQGEGWLARRRGPSPKDTWLCARATTKPKLDGKLDDEIWQHANAIDLHSPQHDDETWPASAMLACDDEFLYLAVRCRQAPGVQYTASDTTTRPRDADLSRRDRIDLLIDIDRDYGTYYRLSIDHRGWTRDECWGDPTWNPTWYVAAGTDGDTWTIEAAIPLAELTRQPIDPKTAWAVGVQRVVPGVGFQSWTTPASPDVIPEGFGYLTFGSAGE